MPVIAVPDRAGRARPGPETLKRGWITASAVLPLLPRRPRPPARHPDGTRLVVVSANLERGTRDAAAQATALVGTDADVLLLTEHAAATRTALEAAGLAEAFPHVADDADEGYFGSLVASRPPLVEARVEDIGGRRGQVVAVDVGGTRVRLVPVHTQAPIWDRDVATWRATVAANAALGAGAGPAVLAGDWNATGGHRAYRRALAAHDLVDAAALLGHRWFPTWPVDLPVLGLPLPPFLTLDHVVVTPDVEVVAVERLELPGSDHRGLRAELRLPSPTAVRTAGRGR